VNPLVIATALTKPYAISFHSALAIRGIGEAIGSRVYIQSPRRFAPLTYEGTDFAWVKAARLFGFDSTLVDDMEVVITDVERTILDCLRFPEYAGGIDELIRSLEGVQRYDMLTEILQSNLEGSGAGWKALRARFEDRRAELNSLQGAGLIDVSADRAYLTLVGLAYCPDPRAGSLLDAVRKVHGRLRARYKEKLDHPIPFEEIEQGTDVKCPIIEFAIMALRNAGVPIEVTLGNTPSRQAIPHEAVLDYRDLDQLLAQRLAEHPVPKELSLRKKGLPYVRFDRMLGHLEAFGEKALYAKAGFLASLFAARWKPPVDFIRAARRQVGRGKMYFPASLPRGTGRLVSEWNLIVPHTLYARYVRSLNPAASEQPDAIV
jgi:hypothetical protein